MFSCGLSRLSAKCGNVLHILFGAFHWELEMGRFYYGEGRNMSPDIGILAEDLEYLEDGQQLVWQCEGCLTFFTEKEDMLRLKYTADREGIDDLNVKGECPHCNGLCREKRVSEADFNAIQDIA